MKIYDYERFITCTGSYQCHNIISLDLNLTPLAAFLRFFAKRSASLRSAKIVKKQKEVSDLKQDYNIMCLHTVMKI